MFPTINWSILNLEILMTTALVSLIVLEIILPKDLKKHLIGTLSFFTLLAISFFWLTQKHVTGAAFGGMFVMDPLAWYFKAFFLTAMTFTCAMVQHFFKGTNEQRNEFYFLLWLALLGMCFAASAADLLLLFIAIEILTISLYVMTAYLKSDKLSIEAGMKYLILGALSSGFFLYGMSFIYGITHSTRFADIAIYADTHAMTPMILFGLVCLVAAIGFKIAAVPFHMWVPDVYQGAPTPVTALLAVGSKATGFIIMLRLFYGIFPAWHEQWSFMLAVLSAVTMTYGNLAAIFQTNIKRLLGYSSIAHAGYLLMGIAAGSILGASAVNLYLLGYLFSSFAAFLVIILLSRIIPGDDIEDYNGLAKRSHFLSAAMLLALVSLAGLPPLAGFFGKFTLLLATVNSGYIWLALIATANIIISVYYYLKVAQRIYTAPAKNTTSIPVPAIMGFLLAAAMVGIVVMGILPGPFFNEAITAAKVFVSQSL